MNNNHYYIASGAGDIYYTLRYAFYETTYRGVEERDYHIKNLSLDREEAVAKAKAYAEKTQTPIIIDEFTTTQKRRSPSDIDWSIFQAGKHVGQSIHEVAETDKDYLVWLCSQEGLPAKYVKTAELAKALVQHELEAVAAEKAQKAEKAAERLATAQPILDLFQDLEVTVTHEKARYGYIKLETPRIRPSWGAEKLIEAIKNGRNPHPTIVQSAIEDRLKVEGHSNRGKANQERRNNRYQQIATLFEECTTPEPAKSAAIA
jgi:hypothetical protein